MTHITQKEWNRLTDKEKEILKSIGIKPTEKHKAPAAQARGIKPPKPYTIEITIHCQLCKSTPKKYFDMVLAENVEVPYLHAIPISKEEAFKKPTLVKRETPQSTCCECYEKLHKWKKEELIMKLIKVYPSSSIGAGR